MATGTLEQRVSALEQKIGGDEDQVTRILVVQDRSGSMGSRVEETITGFNEYLEDLAGDDSDEAYLTLIQFNTTYTVVEESTPVDEVEPLTDKTYKPSGGTALLDAVGRGITDLQDELEDDERALVIIMTDGMENSSREYSADAVKKLIKRCECKGNWTFVFLGASQDSWTGGDLLGLRKNQTVFYGGDAHSHGLAFASLSGTTRGYRGGQSASLSDMGAATADNLAKEGGSVKKETTTSGSER